MERNTLAHPHPETNPHLSDPLLIILGISLASLTALDFAIHPNQGLSDPAIREFAQTYLGDVIRYIGNFGLAAAITIPIAAIKKFLERSNTTPWNKTVYDNILEHSYHLGIAGIATSVMLMESFPGNNDLVGDIAMTWAGIINAKVVTEETLHRFRLARTRQLPSRLDKIFPNRPRSFLYQVANSTDEIFP